jgi:hypothetical protein
MRKLFLGILLTVSVTAYSQYYTLPSVIADSLVFEVQQGRQCAEITALQAVQLTNLSDIVDSQSKAIELLKTQTNALQGQVYIWEQTLVISGEQNKRLKKSIVKWKLIAIGQAVLIILVVL